MGWWWREPVRFDVVAATPRVSISDTHPNAQWVIRVRDDGNRSGFAVGTLDAQSFYNALTGFTGLGEGSDFKEAAVVVLDEVAVMAFSIDNDRT